MTGAPPNLPLVPLADILQAACFVQVGRESLGGGTQEPGREDWLQVVM